MTKIAANQNFTRFVGKLQSRHITYGRLYSCSQIIALSNVDPDQTAPIIGAVNSGSALFVITLHHFGLTFMAILAKF